VGCEMSVRCGYRLSLCFGVGPGRVMGGCGFSMRRTTVEVQCGIQVASIDRARLVERCCGEGMWSRVLDTAMRNLARHHDCKYVWYPEGFVQEGNDAVVPALLALAVCDPNDRNVDHLMMAVRAIVAARLVLLTVEALGRGCWHWVP
jgi:hypothetical protein